MMKGIDTEAEYILTMFDRYGQPDFCEIVGTINDVQRTKDWLLARGNTHIEFMIKEEDIDEAS